MSDPNEVITKKRLTDGMPNGGQGKVVTVTSTGNNGSKRKKTSSNTKRLENAIFDSVSDLIVDFFSTPDLVAFSSCSKGCGRWSKWS